jgi:hypothetical protein
MLLLVMRQTWRFRAQSTRRATFAWSAPRPAVTCTEHRIVDGETTRARPWCILMSTDEVKEEKAVTAKSRFENYFFQYSRSKIAAKSLILSYSTGITFPSVV